MTTRETLIDGGINWNWYLQADLNKEERTAHIFLYDRWHKDDYPHPQVTLPRSLLIILQDGKRHVYGLKIEGVEYLVTNPAHIFDYRDRTHIQFEGAGK